jgi:hypothetical protein
MPVAHVIMVTPTEGGWRVHAQSLSLDHQFQSGAQAEAAAKAVAERLADEGARSEIHVHLRDGTRVGKFICCPAARSPRPVLEPASP